MSGRAGPHALCVLYPARGHVLPLLPVLRELVAAGCRVTATTGADTADEVRATGAAVVVYARPLRAAMPPTRTAAELSRALLERLEEVLDVAPDVTSALPAPPDVVVHDVGMALPARLYALRHGCPVVQTMTILASNEHFSLAEALTTHDGVPVLPGPGASGEPPADPAAARYQQRVAEFAARHGTADPPPAPPPRTVVLLPRRFQPCADTFGDDHVFVGPSPGPDTGPWTPPPGRDPLAVVVMSTSADFSPDFFRATALGLRAAGRRVVVAMGGRAAAGDLGALPPGVHVHDWLPLEAVLGHAALFVSQGGMGTVMAAARHAVPAVYVPHLPEPLVNARRAEELGLARVVPAAGATPEAVVAAARGLAADPGLPARLAAMREHAASGGGPARAAAEILAQARRGAVG